MSMINEFVEKLIGRLEEKQDEYFHGTSDYEEGKYNAYDEVAQIVNQLAEEYKDVPDTNNNGWVPCGEKCPPNDTYCLIADYKGDIRIEKHLSGNEWYAGFNYVIAWQPLPEPYKGE